MIVLLALDAPSFAGNSGWRTGASHEIPHIRSAAQLIRRPSINGTLVGNNQYERDCDTDNNYTSD
jgi:hypothetical protein